MRVNNLVPTENPDSAPVLATGSSLSVLNNQMFRGALSIEKRALFASMEFCAEGHMLVKQRCSLQGFLLSDPSG